jgi:putative spermidine/putrescine transport system permease protein
VTVLALRSTDASDLKTRLTASLRARRARALLFVAPLLIFVAVVFLGPIVMLLERSVAVPDMQSLLPNTAQALGDWHGPDLPAEAAWQAFVLDLRQAQAAGTASKIAAVLNQEISGARTLVIATAREAPALAPPFRDALVQRDERWADPALWGTIKRLSSGWTLSYYANALDLRVAGYDAIERQPEGRRIYLALFARTLKVAGLVTLICLLLAYPVAYLLASVSSRTANLLLMLVLLPFWTSLLVRTTAWIVLLQKQGVINDILVWAGIVSDESRVALIYNQAGTLIAMSHVLLPFMILPIYAVMKGVPPAYLRAAMSLGATPLTAFRRVYLPQTMPGVGAGVILVFILAIGYYITPGLVGGDSGALISNLIAYHIQKSLNWGLAAALSTLLLLAVLALYWLYDRIVGIDNLKLG